ncbi:TIGR04282 family arsenosugar biosynthesis glycosyltransferase [Cognatishimia sp. F0-27]|uniref:TIGR04282 family arsenosugar biosynthesis glycosyltransferase n=1 Tax=Cognatishimia sp. F0-27 TaxID=2816855 RepID=UPI001D0C649A|nr:TIGR04282 family arsenosugar biosynthesis glycosyltransferase [Cognatishimia sp. F0-27]MCC1494251.1 TIGR04282 family arsenosugar biosynthesis glycosyltransferase [Cognatishimia sp. F0-27]
MPGRRSLVVMVKEPRPGRVKTRLARDIGSVPATWWFRHQVDRLTRSIRDPRWQTVLAVAPDKAVTSRVFDAALPRVAQGRGDLGARMARAMRQMPPGPVCVIGADVPGITPAHVARAFRALGDAETVFGPAEDGGYWLVGVRNARAFPPGLFEGVRWSSRHALADSVASLGKRRVALVDRLRDVDRAADL